VLDILDRARGFEDALDELVNHFDTPPDELILIQKKAEKITKYLRVLADDLEDREI
jgi:hypothetical protein